MTAQFCRFRAICDELLQIFAGFDFALHYALPVTVFAYCYSRIILIIRHQKKIFTVPDVAISGLSHDVSTGLQVQQQDGKLSRTQLNVVQTMIFVIVCFVVCWTPSSLAVIVQSIEVCCVRFCTYRHIRDQTNLFLMRCLYKCK